MRVRGGVIIPGKASMNASQLSVERVVVVVQGSEGGSVLGEPVSVLFGGSVVAEQETDVHGKAVFDLSPGEYEIRIRSAVVFGALHSRVRIPAPEAERHFSFGI